MVLASGGYQGNAEMMARYHGDRALTARPVARGGNYNKGEGIEMALAVGAATAGNFSLFHAEPVDPRSGEPEAAIFCFPYGVLVNAEGERFVDEARGPIDAWYERTTRDIHAQTDGHRLGGARPAGAGRPQHPVRDPHRHRRRCVADIGRGAGGRHRRPRRRRSTATLAAYNAACGDGDVLAAGARRPGHHAV